MLFWENISTAHLIYPLKLVGWVLFNLRNLAITMLCFGINFSIGLVMIKVVQDRSPGYPSLANFTTKDFVSPSFTLSGSPVKVRLCTSDEIHGSMFK
jgi:hypothetical protein